MKDDRQFLSISYLLYACALILVGLISLQIFPVSHLFKTTFPEVLANWDGGYYLAISEGGYQQLKHFAFLPVYPLAVRLLSFLLNSYLWAALLISWSAAAGSLYLLYQLIKEEKGHSVARKTIIYLLLFPTSFFLFAVYTESLFLFLTLASFFLFEKKSFKLNLLASLILSLTLLTRVVGLAVYLAILLNLIKQKQLKEKWMILLSPLSLVFYYLLSVNNFGEGTLFFKAEQSWLRTTSLSGLDIFGYLPELFTRSLTVEGLIFWLEFIFLVFGLGLAIRICRTQKLSYALYTVFSLIIILISGSLMSTPRLLLVIFPIYLALAEWRSTDRFKSLTRGLPWQKIYWIISGGLLIFFYCRFINGFWIS